MAALARGVCVRFEFNASIDMVLADKVQIIARGGKPAAAAEMGRQASASWSSRWGQLQPLPRST
jgi:hypothetical protein